VEYEVLTAVVLKSSFFWDITSCSPLKVNRHFGGTCHLHLQGQRISHAELCLPAAFALIYCLTYSSTLQVKETCSTEMSDDVHGVISRKTDLSTVNLCMHAHHTRHFHADYDKWCNRGSREGASNPHSARWLKRQHFSLLFGRQPV
jgi:hypothetical protein